MLIRSEAIGPITVQHSRGGLRFTGGLLHSDNDQPAVEMVMSSLCDKNQRVSVNYLRCQEWYAQGLLHRENDKPAIISYAVPRAGIGSANKKIERLEWYVCGRIHRANDMPAIVEYVYETEHWYINGVRHRDSDKPAVMTNFGTMHWYVNGLAHRDCDRPSYTANNGTHEWYIRGQSQRLDPRLPVTLRANGVSLMADGRMSRCERLWRITSRCVRKQGDPWYVSSLAPDCTCASGDCKSGWHAMWCDCGHPKREHIDTNEVVRSYMPAPIPEMACTCGKCH